MSASGTVRVVGLILAISLIGASGSIGATAARPVLSASLANSTSSAVVFNVDILPLSSLTVSLVLTANTSLSGGSINPGQTVTGYATVTVPRTVDLAITYDGVSTSVTIPGVGTSYDVAVPGLGLSYLGVGLGVFLNFSGVITALSSVSGAGQGGAGNVSWTASETKNFSVTADNSASGGSSITSSLSNIEYGISIGLDAGAIIPILGHYVVHLLNFGSIGVFQGNPSAVQSSYAVSVPPSLGGALTTSSAAIGLALVVAVIAAVGLGVVLWRRRRRPPPPTLPPMGPPTSP